VLLKSDLVVQQTDHWETVVSLVTTVLKNIFKIVMTNLNGTGYKVTNHLAGSAAMSSSDYTCQTF
jgi:hypothetical protein